MAAPEAEVVRGPGSMFEAARERDLFRYYRPPGFVDHGNQQLLPETSPPGPPISTDQHLTALAQLVALRMNSKRSIVSVVHRQRSYVIAEATRSVLLTDTSRASTKGDEIYFGCSSLARADSMCDFVVGCQETSTKSPIFLVSDMSQDVRFQDRPMVTSGPRFMFYAGAPLKTPRGITIGAISAVDDTPRAGISQDEEDFLLHVAGLVVDILERRRIAEEKDKLRRMSRGLNAFVQGRSRLPRDVSDLGRAENKILGASPVETAPSSSLAGPKNGSSEIDRPTEPTQRPSPGLRSSTEESTASDRSVTTPETPKGAESHQTLEQIYTNTLSRAAELLWESMSLQGAGGVVILDTATGGNKVETHLDDPQPQDKVQHLGDSNVYSASVSGRPETITADVLAKHLSTSDLASGASEGTNGLSFRPMDQESLHRVVKRYPKGKLWILDGEWAISSSEDEPTSSNGSQHNMTKRRDMETRLLQHCFPGARAVVFVPLWDASETRHASASWAWTTSPLHNFSKDTELIHMTIFSNSITTEISRLLTLDADKKKVDFLGSISHELRSPLHGILASADFLADSSNDSSQRRLVDNIQVCGRTLLDEINHILEFSRINTFEREQRKPARLKRGHGPENGRERGLSSLPAGLAHISNTNVAVVIEEAVESVFADRGHSNFSAVTLGDDFRNGEDHETLEGPNGERSDLRAATEKGAVEVILDFDHFDYQCVTYPGALRRVVTNLFTNAMKYTEQGTILVKLRRGMVDDGTEKPRENIVLIVRDSGRGMSSTYLRTSLFTPFAQENTMAPGTGLGLSIVRSILTTLDGTINVNSKLFEGTEVQVSLPIMPPGQAVSPSSEPSIGAAASDEGLESVSFLRSSAAGKRVALCGFEDSLTKGERIAAFDRVLRTYITAWFGLECSNKFDPLRPPDLVILHENIREKFFEEHPQTHKMPMLILTDGLQQPEMSQVLPDQVCFLSKPLGPYRLAKAVRACLETSANGVWAPATPRTDALRRRTSETRSPPKFRNSYLAAKRDEALATTHDRSENAPEAVNSPGKQGGKDLFGSPLPKYKDTGSPLPVKSLPQRDRPLNPHANGKASTEAAHGVKKLEVPEKALPSTERGAEAPVESATVPAKRLPSILLVDDNKINLNLLQMFMRKRRYRDVDSAENGALAVQRAQARDYDIIFMDISMPVMDGFAATREIRAMEQRRRRHRREDAEDRRASLQGSPRELPTAAGHAEGNGVHDGESPPPPPTLIVALTGLASSQDQREAFSSGVNLYMTKPVAFKDVEQLLSNWESRSAEKAPGSFIDTGTVTVSVEA